LRLDGDLATTENAGVGVRACSTNPFDEGKVLGMAGAIRDEDFRIDSGRAEGGRMFVRVVHEPTQTSRVVVGLKSRPYAQVVQDLLSEVRQEIEAVGWRRPQKG
jgi:hypothetical protein